MLHDAVLGFTRQGIASCSAEADSVDHPGALMVNGVNKGANENVFLLKTNDSPLCLCTELHNISHARPLMVFLHHFSILIGFFCGNSVSAAAVVIVSVMLWGVGKFSLGSGRKKDRSRLRTVPEIHSISTLVWPVTVEDFSLDRRLDCSLAIGQEMLVIIDDDSKGVIFALPCCDVIGWTVLQSNA